MKLTDADIAILLTPCECGHTINDHGELAGCWACGDDERDCRVSFEALLTRAVEAIVARAVNEALTEAARYLSQCAVHEFDQHGPADPRGAALWDAATWIAEEHRSGVRARTKSGQPCGPCRLGDCDQCAGSVDAPCPCT